LLTFFAAAKKVSAAPHRGNANRPEAKQGKANTVRTPTKHQGAAGKKRTSFNHDSMTNAMPPALSAKTARPLSQILRHGFIPVYGSSPAS
jgi:hypothetical protein